MQHDLRLAYLVKLLKKGDLEEALIKDRRTLVSWFQEHASELADLTLEMLFDPNIKEEIIGKLEEALKKISS